MAEFTHLHVHTEYSLLDGSSKIEEILKQAKNLGMDSLAITDHGVMYGCIDFYKAAKKVGIKPILGCEVYVAPGSRFDKGKSKSEDDTRYYHLILLAENNLGYRNLCKIVSKGFVEGYYYKPRVDYEVLREFHEGIICLSACLAGEVQKYLANGQYEEGKAAALRYLDIFGDGNYFLELQDHGINEQETVNQQLLRLSEDIGVELVCTNDVHYTYADDAEAHDILLCIQTGKKKSDTDRMIYEGGQYYLKSPEEMAKLFPYAPSALANTCRIADRCNVEIEFGNTQLPEFGVPDGYTTWTYLVELCSKGLKERYPAARGEKDDSCKMSGDELRARLKYELDTIRDMGYVEYFLIVWDFINYAKNNGIMVGPGRGSAAGSIVSYCLKITDIDPIKFDLLFERFLNPERVSMPDIDVDFCIERRQEVIDYVSNKYGRDHVAQIVTFGTLKARNVIRDVGRVLEMPYAQVDTIAKMVPMDQHTLKGALDANKEFKALYDSDSQVKYLIDMSMRLEGLPRHASMHAAGVVICAKPVDEYVPLSRGSDGAITTQYVMTTLEELGLLKMDFLGLRNLTVIRNALQFVKENRGEEIDLQALKYDDREVLDYIGTGNTDGIFQLESTGMRNFMKELKPQSLDDIIAGIALYRPGPMDFIPKYLKGKNDASSITYDCPQLEPILKSTYGCIVYQEQVMQIVRDLAGYSLGKSDILRRAMSKKKQDVMVRERQNFVYGNPEENIKGCVNNGISEDVANRIYDEMMDFAKYAFNKSHAAAYAVVAYQTAYLKYYYTAEFMAAMLTSVTSLSDKVAEYVYACKNMNIQILPPDINESESGFSARGNAIRYGLTAIKNIGKAVVDAIVSERAMSGPYKDLEDFVRRTADFGVNKRAVENFIRSGAFDSFGATRKQMVMVYEQVIDSILDSTKNEMDGQVSFLDTAIFDAAEKKKYSVEYPDVGEFPDERLLADEKEVLGIYVSGHPLKKYEEKIRVKSTNTSLDFVVKEDEEQKVTDKKSVVVGGLISEVTKHIARDGRTMAFLSLEDLMGVVEVVVFARTYDTCRDLISEGNAVFIEGTVSIREGKNASVLANKITAMENTPYKVWIMFSDVDALNAADEKMRELSIENPGNDRIIVYIKKTRQKKDMPSSYNISLENITMDRMEQIFGKDNVALR